MTIGNVISKNHLISLIIDDYQYAAHKFDEPVVVILRIYAADVFRLGR